MDQSLGNFLRSEREKKGIRLEEIASITKIHIHSLELLESNELERLPPEPFIRGFIIAYAKYIGMDPKDALGRYLEGKETKSPTPAPNSVASPEVVPPVGPSHTGGDPQDLLSRTWTFQTKKFFVAGFAIGIFILTFTIIFVGKKASEEVAQAPEPAPKVEVEATKETPSPAAAPTKSQPAATAAPEPSKVAQEPRIPAANLDRETQSRFPAMAEGMKHQIYVETKEPSWMKVVIDDEPPIESYIKENTKKAFHAKSKIKVVLGNATNAQVFHNGQVSEGKKVAETSTVKFYIYPRGSRFPQDPVKKASKPENESQDTAQSTGTETAQPTP